MLAGYVCRNKNYVGGQEISVLSSQRCCGHRTVFNGEGFWAEDVEQLVACLLSVHKALGLSIKQHANTGPSS